MGYLILSFKNRYISLCQRSPCTSFDLSVFVLCGNPPPFLFLVYSCSSFLFLITPLRSLPPPSLCLLFVLRAAGSAVLPFVTPTGSSGEDRPL